MTLFVYNTLTARKEKFQSLNPGKVKMYVCGITPYDEPHLGHARCYVVFDTIYRYLKWIGYEVTYIQNITDIDDKIIKRSQQLNISYQELTKKYIEKYLRLCEKLNILHPDEYPRVTGHIPEIISFIEKLIEGGAGYQVNGDVYFSVNKFKKYGQLSKRSTDEMLAGARVEIDERKKDPLDFALWKSSKENEPGWDSPWGRGRPGWHIECSVLSMKYLGDSFDIHGGGQDLIFPHHENEIAQSEFLTGKKFVRYWIHNGFVTVDGQKMSKSLGNIVSLEELFRSYNPSVVRYFLLDKHYRKPLDFSEDKLKAAARSLDRLVNLVDFSDFITGKVNPEKTAEYVEIKDLKEKFFQAMNDDFNTELAISLLHQMASIVYEEFDKKEKANISLIKFANETIKELSENLLGISLKLEGKIPPEEIERLLSERERLRSLKNWKKADEIRSKLNSLGVIVEDTYWGPRWRWKMF